MAHPYYGILWGYHKEWVRFWCVSLEPIGKVYISEDSG